MRVITVGVLLVVLHGCGSSTTPAVIGSSQPSNSNSKRSGDASSIASSSSSSNSGTGDGANDSSSLSSADTSMDGDVSSVDSNITASRSRNSSKNSTAIATNKIVVADETLRNAQVLRDVGKSYLSSKQYSKAALCYSAVLQVIEGVGGKESGEIRQRCSLTLAECEIKLGNLYSAIARCSEVIDESPDLPFLDVDTSALNIGSDAAESASTSLQPLNNEEYERLSKFLSQARYRRGVALFRLDEPELALIDLHEALRMVPGDERIQERIETIESVLLNSDRSGASESVETISATISTEQRTEAGSGVSTTSGGAADHPEQILEERRVEERRVEERQEQFQGIIEDSLVNYPRVLLSKKQITDIVRTRRIGGTSSSQRISKTTNIMATAKSSGGVGGMGGLGGMMDLLEAGGGGLGALAGGGGLGNIGSMLGGLMGSESGGNPLGAIGPMLQMFFGVDAVTVKNVGEMGTAIWDVYKLFEKGFRAMQKHKGTIALVLTMVWVALSGWPFVLSRWGSKR